MGSIEEELTKLLHLSIEGREKTLASIDEELAKLHLSIEGREKILASIEEEWTKLHLSIEATEEDSTSAMTVATFQKNDDPDANKEHGKIKKTIKWKRMRSFIPRIKSDELQADRLRKPRCQVCKEIQPRSIANSRQNED